jgi:hypothetical protein
MLALHLHKEPTNGGPTTGEVGKDNKYLGLAHDLLARYGTSSQILQQKDTFGWCGKASRSKSSFRHCSCGERECLVVPLLPVRGLPVAAAWQIGRGLEHAFPVLEVE